MPTFHALLIGADCYFPNRLSGGRHYRSLGGCVNDVARVRALLEAQLRTKPEVTVLTAAMGADGRPTGDPATWPTAANLRQALAALAERAVPGDQVYIHYSGHGGRVDTTSPALKGEAGVDEALVPIDIGGDDPAAPGEDPERYIRDVELALYLDRLAQKTDAAERTITITLVFDSCHAGGATRDAEVEGVRTATPIAGADVHATRSASRAATAGITWLPPSRGYVLLAGCLDTETAKERTVDGALGGVLTGALIEALRELGSQHSWQTIHARVQALVRGRANDQTPQLVGDIDREVFGAALRPSERSHTVTAVDRANRRVVIDAGQALAITPDMEFDIYPPGTTEFSNLDRRLATAAVYHVAATRSDAAIRTGDIAAIPLGAPAVLRAIPDRHPVAVVDPTASAVLVALATRIEQDRVLALCPPGAAPRHQVRLTGDGTIAIADPAGVALPHLEPRVSVHDDDAIDATVAKLRQLRQYDTVRHMPACRDLIDDHLQVELLAAPAGWTEQLPMRRDDGHAIARADDGTYEVGNGTWLWLWLANKRPGRTIHVALVVLGRHWHVDLVVPNPKELNGKPSETVADRPRMFSFMMHTSDAAVVDVFKLYAATSDVDFRQLTTTRVTRARTRGERSVYTRDVDPGTVRNVPDWGIQQFQVRTRP